MATMLNSPEQTRKAVTDTVYSEPGDFDRAQLATRIIAAIERKSVSVPAAREP